MQYTPVTPPAAETAFFVQSAEPADLQARLAALIADQQLTARPAVSSCELGGAGEGHTFVCRIAFVSGAALGAIASASVYAYLASDAVNLPLARAAVLNGVVGNKVDELLAGASKGHRFMGLVVTGVVIDI